MPRFEQSPHPQSSIPHSTYGKPMPLNLQRKVFLSHSGRDKEFVRHLDRALLRAYNGIKVTFFDEDSIPKGEAVSMENILGDARASELGVLVITDDFFTHTRNPMLELEAFVDAEVKLLPLFFTMSVEHFKAKVQRERWKKKWGEWSVLDDKLERWVQALSLLSDFSGLEYCKIATNQSDYIDKVVKEVTRIIGPAIPLSKGASSNRSAQTYIPGKDRLCEMVDDMYKEAASKRSCVQNTSNCTQAASTSASNSGLEEECRITSDVVSYNVTSDVVGIHGFAGLGKSTICNWLCDYYHQKLSLQVCYIDVGSSPASPEQNSAAFRGRLQDVLRSLCPSNNANDSNQFQNLSNNQLENLLRGELSSKKDPVFLAIDNIHSEEKTLEEANWYLRCTFPEGSKIFITSRSEKILANLSGQLEFSFSVVTAYLPPLTLEEARDIFVLEFAELGKRRLTNEEEDHVNECVNVCTIDKKRYHPLMLKSLAAYIRWDGSTPHLDWKGRLAMVRSKGIDDIKDDVWRRIFTMFELPYELLSGEERKVFLDLAIATHAVGMYSKYNWINMLHSSLGLKKLDKIMFQLQAVCFIESKWSECIKIVDLLVDFAKYKARDEGKYVVVDGSTLLPDPDQLPSSARHISISRVHCKASLGTQLDLRGVDGVEVLHLVANAGLQHVLLSPTTFAHLRSLIVIVPECTTLCCTLDEDEGARFLKWMRLEGNVSFQRTGASGHLSVRGLLTGSSDTNFHLMTKIEISGAIDPVSILACPRSLEMLHLRDLPNVQSIDLTTCANLKNVNLCVMPSLKFIRGLEGNSQSLQKVYIGGCKKLLALTISANSGACHVIDSCDSLETLSFWAGSGAECRRTSRQGSLLFSLIKQSVPRVDGFAQYTGHMVCSSHRSVYGDWFCAGAGTLEDFFECVAIKDAGVDLSLCKATVTKFEVDGYNQAGLAGVIEIGLDDAQHVGLFISALFKAQPECLASLCITCKRGGDCGCDQNAPYFNPLPLSAAKYCNTIFNHPGPKLMYSCPQVRDLASLAQWHVLKRLDLHGCTSVEVWPDFAAFTSLECLNLSKTSLKEWPAAVLLLPCLEDLDLSDCWELPAEELIKNSTIAVLESMTSAHRTCKVCSLASLKKDLEHGGRDRCSVADALVALSPQLEVLFDCSFADDIMVVQQLVVEIMYLVWFGEIHEEDHLFEEEDLIEEENPIEEWQYLMRKMLMRKMFRRKMHIRKKMRGLLCSESFLSLPFRAWNEVSLSAVAAIRGANTDQPVIELLEDWFNKIEEGSKAWTLAIIGLLGIALVGEAVSLGASPDKKCVLNFLQSPFKDELFIIWEEKISVPVRKAEKWLQCFINGG